MILLSMFLPDWMGDWSLTSMKQTKILDNVQRQMRPGVITQTGFLGTDPRRLGDILAEDDAAVKRLDLTHAQIAARMKELSDAGRKGLGLAVTVAPHFEIQVESVRGKLPCPFLDGIFAKTNTTVRNTELDREITYTDLGIHMVEAHGFYEGKGALFRLDPAELQTVLEIAPEED
jgi:hypothetical protein